MDAAEVERVDHAASTSRWRHFRWLAIVGPLVPVLLLGSVIVRFAVDVPFTDEWSLVDDIEDYLSGSWGPAEILRSHNGHRIAIPRLVMVPLAALTGWETRAPIALSFALALATGVLLLRGLGPALATVEEPLRSLTVTLCSLTLFSFNQFESWLWGFMVCSFLGMAGTVAALFLLSDERPSPLCVVAAAAFALGASWSHGSGLLAWPIGAALLALGSFRANRRAILAWTVIGGAVWGGYFIPMSGDVNPYTRPFILDSALGWVSYTLNVMGAPLLAMSSPDIHSRNTLPGLLAGLVGLGLTLPLVARAVRHGVLEKRWVRFAVGLVLLATGSAALTGLGRGSGGPSTAHASRYLTWSTPLWLVVAVVMARAAMGRRPAGSRWAARLGLATLAVLVSWSSVAVLPNLAIRRDILSLAAEGLYHGGPEAFLSALQPQTDLVHHGRPTLVRRRLSVFRESRPPRSASNAPLTDFGGQVELLAPPRFAEGVSTWLEVRVTNTSEKPWPYLGKDMAGSHAVHLSSRWWKHGRLVRDGPRARLPWDLPPGSSVVLSLCVVPPPLGRYRLEIGLVQENVAWFSDHASGAWRQRTEVTAAQRGPIRRVLTSAADALTGESCR